MMFNIELPEFFQKNSMDQYFLSNINDLFNFKNNDYFEMEALEEFTKVSDDLENALLDLSSAINHKINYFRDMQHEHSSNNDKLRELNDQLVIVKIQRRSYDMNKNSENGKTIEGF